MWARGSQSHLAAQTLARHRLTVFSGSFLPRPDDRRLLHDYFVSHIPSPSLSAPQVRDEPGPSGKGPQPASSAGRAGTGQGQQDRTVVRIPLRSARHHFGASSSRGQRRENEDRYQVGVIEIPAFAQRPPISLNRETKQRWLSGEAMSADGASGDPQVFYFGVFDGHGGPDCSEFLSEELHNYVELAAQELQVQSTLKKSPLKGIIPRDKHGNFYHGPIGPDQAGTSQEADPETVRRRREQIAELERSLIGKWRDLVGGYYSRFQPQFFSADGGGQGYVLTQKGAVRSDGADARVEKAVEYAFLHADYDFMVSQARKRGANDSVAADRALNEADILDAPGKLSQKPIGDPNSRFLGGSTCSTVLISTPSGHPFWNPAARSSMLVAHVGDTRVIMCRTIDGEAIGITRNHHLDLPTESERLRRYSLLFSTDSFGEQRVAGLANTRSFGDMSAKRVGVSAEPDLVRLELGPAEYSFVVLASDGVTGTVSDQEIVDIVKEANTPEEGAKAIVRFVDEVSKDGDNATALVVRLGGWERRAEGGNGGLRTSAFRMARRAEEVNPRQGRQ